MQLFLHYCFKLHPIESAFSKFKAILPNLAARIAPKHLDAIATHCIGHYDEPVTPGQGAGKRIKGRKRHILSNTESSLVRAVVYTEFAGARGVRTVNFPTLAIVKHSELLNATGQNQPRSIQLSTGFA